MIVGITRVRNEELILEDTLRHFNAYCDEIIVYDDCSTDRTVEIASDMGARLIRGGAWLSDRRKEETRHRAILLCEAKRNGADWCLCFDADERLIGELPPLTGNGWRFRLFDGYMTEERCEPYAEGELGLLPRMWGPEYRDILMLFPVVGSRYEGLDRREPIIAGTSRLAPVFVKHFGKCLSVEHWEETCTYYSEHFPEPYRTKWEKRKGHAIHTTSDFGRPLYAWYDLICNRNLWVRL